MHAVPPKLSTVPRLNPPGAALPQSFAPENFHPTCTLVRTGVVRYLPEKVKNCQPEPNQTEGTGAKVLPQPLNVAAGRTAQVRAVEKGGYDHPVPVNTKTR